MLPRAHYEGTVEQLRLSELVLLDAPLDLAVRLVAANGGQILSAHDLAYARGSCTSSMCCGSYTREAISYLPGEGGYLLRHSPLLDLQCATQAVEAHKSGREYFVAYPLLSSRDALFGSVGEQSTEIYRLPHSTRLRVPSHCFADDGLTVFLFQDLAREYGNLLLENFGVKELEFDFLDQRSIDAMPQPFLRQLWFARYGGGILGTLRDFHLERFIRASFHRSSVQDGHLKLDP